MDSQCAHQFALLVMICRPCIHTDDMWYKSNMSSDLLQATKATQSCSARGLLRFMLSPESRCQDADGFTSSRMNRELLNPFNLITVELVQPGYYSNHSFLPFYLPPLYSQCAKLQATAITVYAIIPNLVHQNSQWH